MLAQPPASPAEYPEVAWLGRSTYCNPYLGFAFALPAELKQEPIYLPVQPKGRHMLLALHLQRLDRVADVLVSAFEDSSEKPAHLAAQSRIQQAHRAGLISNGPHAIPVHGREFYRLHIASDGPGPGNESSYFFVQRGYVVHIAIFSHDHDLATLLESSMEHLELFEPGSACASPAANTGDQLHGAAPVAAYYGPALPTGLVDATVRDAPGYSVPSGQFSKQTFIDYGLGVRIELPPDWQELPPHEAYRITELMRDPTVDPGFSDRRRAMFRACSKVVFTAFDPKTEMIPEVHPGLAVLAMPQGCVPDLVLPSTSSDRTASEDFATVLVRSLGVPLLGHGSSHTTSDGRLTFDLEGTLPYQLPGEKLSRRLSLQVSTTANGRWLIFVYSATPSSSAEHELESRITIGTLGASAQN
jgi:hypothetical protein